MGGQNNYQKDNRQIGGEYGYNNYNNSPQMNQPMMGGGGYGQPPVQGGYGNYGNYKPSTHVETLDIVVNEQQKYGKRPPSMPQRQ